MDRAPGYRPCRSRDNRWYGEPGAELRDEFMLQARLMDLDALTDPSSSEPLVGTLLAPLR